MIGRGGSLSFTLVEVGVDNGDYHLYLNLTLSVVRRLCGHNLDHDVACEHPAAGPVRKWKTVFRFSKARERRLLHGSVWMRGRPINFPV